VVVASNRSDIERRAAEGALAQRKFVTAIDVLVGVGWLEPRRVDDRRQGRVDYLEQVTVANLGKISTGPCSFGGDWDTAAVPSAHRTSDDPSSGLSGRASRRPGRAGVAVLHAGVDRRLQ
jgi:hypothetical protein